MAVLTGGYVGAKSCTSGPTVGAKNLMSWYLRDYGPKGGKNLGIYNCRTVRGGTTTSLHGEGRAADLGTPTSNTWSWAVAELLRAHSAELGIQCVIHNRKIWSASAAGWRAYTGVAAHFDHLHVELTWAAANGGLTVAKIDSVLRPAPVIVVPASNGGARAGDGILERGDKGESVTQLQRVLRAWYPKDLAYLDVDGDFGAETETAVRYAQTKLRLTADGVAGPATLKAPNLSGLR
jgi:Putative peptidoglycan binding domain